MRRIAPIVAVALLAACGKSQPAAAPTARTVQPTVSAGATPDPLSSPCDYPPRIAMAAWVPRDLPLPPGTYMSNDVGELEGVQRGELVVRMSLQAFASFILERWPAAGWKLGFSDAERDEFEQEFQKGQTAGFIKVNTVYCKPGYLHAGLVFRETPATPSP